jgi:hypothetical protein
MNPLFAQRGLTPTAAIALRAQAQESREEFVAKVKEQAEANGVSLTRDSYAQAGRARLAAKAELGSDGNPVATKVVWDPETKTVSVS